MSKRDVPFSGPHEGRVHYYEYRSLTSSAKSLFAAAAVGIVLGTLDIVHEGARLWEAAVMLAGEMILLAALVALVVKTGREFKHIRVDDAGLWVVGHEVVPPEDIADVRVLSQPEARRLMGRQRWNGIDIAPTRSTYYRTWMGFGPAVLVVVDPTARVPPGPAHGRVIATRNPEGLARALIHLVLEVRGEDGDERRPQPVGPRGGPAEPPHDHRSPAARQRGKRGRHRRGDPDRRGGAPDRARPHGAP